MLRSAHNTALTRTLPGQHLDHVSSPSPHRVSSAHSTHCQSPSWSVHSQLITQERKTHPAPPTDIPAHDNSTSEVLLEQFLLATNTLGQHMELDCEVRMPQLSVHVMPAHAGVDLPCTGQCSSLRTPQSQHTVPQPMELLVASSAPFSASIPEQPGLKPSFFHWLLFFWVYLSPRGGFWDLAAPREILTPSSQ